MIRLQGRVIMTQTHGSRPDDAPILIVGYTSIFSSDGATRVSRINREGMYSSDTTRYCKWLPAADEEIKL